MTCRPALEELYATVKYFSLLGYELFKLTFGLHSGTMYPNSSPDRVLKRYLLDRPALTYKNQTYSVQYNFDKKRERNRVQACEEGAVGQTAAERFQGTSYKMQDPKATALLAQYYWLPPNRHWGASGHKCPQELKRVLQG